VLEAAGSPPQWPAVSCDQQPSIIIIIEQNYYLLREKGGCIAECKQPTAAILGE
jgi:hypothetical protein